MKVLLTHGYFILEDEKEQAIMKPYPPLGILYLSAWLKKNGIKHDLFDTTFSTKAKFRSHITAEKPGIVAFYTNLMTKVNVIENIRFIRENEDLKNCKIILGGPDVTHNLENYLNTGADFIVIGEGEQSFLELVTNIQSGNPFFDEINGIAFKNPFDEVVKTKPRAKIKNIDELPFPNREGIDMQLYFDAWKSAHGQSAMTVSTQRGCPYTCKWCSTAVYGQSYRRRSPDLVAEEMAYIKDKFNPDTVWFVDDVFTVSHKWLKGFRDAMVEREVKLPFECITRADRLTEEVLEVLKEAGCFRIWIGAESGSQKIIDAMDRRVSVHKVREMIQAAKKNDIEAGTFIMLGYPGETEEDIEETITHLKVSNPDYFTITVAYPIKGTGLYEEVNDIRTTHPEWNTSTDRDIDFKRTYPKIYYKHALRRVNNEVWFHQQKVENKHLSIKGAKFKIKSLAGKMGMWWTRSRMPKASIWNL